MWTSNPAPCKRAIWGRRPRLPSRRPSRSRRRRRPPSRPSDRRPPTSHRRSRATSRPPSPMSRTPHPVGRRCTRPGAPRAIPKTSRHTPSPPATSRWPIVPVTTGALHAARIGTRRARPAKERRPGPAGAPICKDREARASRRSSARPNRMRRAMRRSASPVPSCRAVRLLAPPWLITAMTTGAPTNANSTATRRSRISSTRAMTTPIVTRRSRPPTSPRRAIRRLAAELPVGVRGLARPSASSRWSSSSPASARRPSSMATRLHPW